MTSLALSPDWEVLRRKMPRVDTLMAATCVRRKKIVIAGGISLHHVFDIRSQSWRRLPPVLPKGVLGRSVVSIENTVLVMGGAKKKINQNISEYSDAIHSVTLRPWFKTCRTLQIPSMMTKRTCFSASVVSNGNIVVAGGFDETSSLKAAEFFDGNGWRPLPDMSELRSSSAAVAVDNKFYVFGGRAGPKPSLCTAEALNLDTEQWEALPNMPRHRVYGVAVAVGHFVLLIGGSEGNEDDTVLDVVDCYDTLRNEWVTNAVPRLAVPRARCAAAFCGRYVHVFGGINPRDRFLDSVERIQINPYRIHVTKLDHMFRQNQLPLGLWPHIIEKSPSPSIIYFVLLSGKFQLDSVLVSEFSKEKKQQEKVAAL